MSRATCDGCGRTIDTERELRFEARWELTAIIEPLAAEEEPGDRDHLLEIHELLERCGDSPDLDAAFDAERQATFSVCRDCAQRLARDPLGRPAAAREQFHFSEN